MVPRALGTLRVAVTAMAALIVLAPLLASSPASAAEEEKVGISARPADASGTPDARTSFRYTADPGQRVDDFFLVTNTGTADQSFTVVSTDAFNDGEGEFALLATAEQPVDIGNWVQFENGANRIEFVLSAGQSRLLPFTLQLPADATPGDHVGGLVASVVTPGAEVNLDRRVASRVYTRVSGDLQPRLAVSSIEAAYGGDWWNPFSGAVTFHYTVSNTGNIALAGNATGAVGTWFGIPVATASGGTIKEVLPGNSATYEVGIPGVGQLGYLLAQVKLTPFVDSGDAAAQMPAPPTSRDTIVIALPWLLLIAIVLVAGFFVFRSWRRKVDAQRAAEWIAYTEAEAKLKAEREVVGAGAGAER
ncbi:dihydroorotate dehydrogenase (fumarate) [Microbacterium trichothecenolyticum]|uniref:hypothetical protein n=1 Tax=Microbacterium trichothecenolyticum TaxID=69370 RepID=UPI00286759B6|nr:hypothetical protein [Microbacterium trichothecenolyticum]MDR7182984.1 dihydroorotate dehydrogenase (fumarate) [Microbacterium trichothecenolyticum]